MVLVPVSGYSTCIRISEDSFDTFWKSPVLNLVQLYAVSKFSTSKYVLGMARDSIDTAVFAAGRACIQGGGHARQSRSELYMPLVGCLRDHICISTQKQRM